MSINADKSKFADEVIVSVETNQLTSEYFTVVETKEGLFLSKSEYTAFKLPFPFGPFNEVSSTPTYWTIDDINQAATVLVMQLHEQLSQVSDLPLRYYQVLCPHGAFETINVDMTVQKVVRAWGENRTSDCQRTAINKYNEMPVDYNLQGYIEAFSRDTAKRPIYVNADTLSRTGKLQNGSLLSIFNVNFVMCRIAAQQAISLLSTMGRLELLCEYPDWHFHSFDGKCVRVIDMVEEISVMTSQYPEIAEFLRSQECKK
jgi:hypothetical protein